MELEVEVTRLKLLDVGRFETQLSVGNASKVSTVYVRAFSSDDLQELPKFRFTLPEEWYARSSSGRQMRVALSVFDRNTQQPDLLYGEGETLVSLPLTSEEAQHSSSLPASAYVTSGSKVEALKRVVAASHHEAQLVLTASTEGFSLGRFKGRAWLKFSPTSTDQTLQHYDSQGDLADHVATPSVQVDQRSLADTRSLRGSTVSSHTVSSGEDNGSEMLQWTTGMHHTGDPVNDSTVMEGGGQLSVTQVAVGLVHQDVDDSSGRLEGPPTAPPPHLEQGGLHNDHAHEPTAHQLNLPSMGAMATSLSGPYHSSPHHPVVMDTSTGVGPAMSSKHRGGPPTMNTEVGQVLPGLPALARDEVSQVLAAELKDAREAMHKMGEDILRLRKTKDELSKELSMYKRLALPESQQEGPSLSLQELSGMTKPDLVLKVAELQSLRASLNQQLLVYKEKVVLLQNELIVHNDEELGHLQLQDAHKQQQQLLVDLQRKAERYRKCAETCKIQEEVIARLESLVCQEVGTSHGIDASRAHAVLKEENGRLRGTAKELEYQASLFPGSSEQRGERDSRVQELIAKCHSLEAKVRDMIQARTEFNTNLQFSELERKLHFVQLELDCVREQLHLSAQSWAAEKTRLELTIARMEGGLRSK